MSEKLSNVLNHLRIYFLIPVIGLGIIGVFYIRMLMNHPELAMPQDMAYMIQQNTYSVQVAVAAVIVYAIRKYNRLAFAAGVVTLIYGMGYLITYKNTWDIAVWSAMAIVVIGITLNISELLKPCKTWFKIPKHQCKGTGG